MSATAEPAKAGPARQSPWAPLRHPVFRAIFIAQLASNVGSLMQSVGSSWLMGDLKASASMVAFVQTAAFLPVMLLGIPAGALADIVDRRRLLMVTQTWMLLSASVLAVLAFTGGITKLSLLALTFSLGVGGAMNAPAFQAIQPELVPPSEFGQAVALGSLTFNVGRAIGPAVGGLIVAAAGPGWVYAINALSFLGTVAVLQRWRPEVRSQTLPVESLAGATRGALRYAANAPILRGVLARTALLWLPASALQALLPIVARGPLQLGSGGYGLLLACFGSGAVCAAVARPRIVARFDSDQLVTFTTLVLVAALLVQGLVRNPAIIAVALVAAGAAWTTSSVTTTVAAMSVLPSWVRARGMGIYMLTLSGSLGIGSALWGALADWQLRSAHLVAAACLVVGIAIGRLWPLARAANVDIATSAVDTATNPLVAMTPEPTDGPVLVTVAYRVVPEDMAEFTDVMRRVERHRRRTGAYQWGLFRDLAEPDVFLETFHVSSWVEHLRQHGRYGTQSDLIDVARYRAAEVAPAHFISAYSDGALGALEPHHDSADDD